MFKLNPLNVSFKATLNALTLEQRVEALTNLAIHQAQDLARQEILISQYNIDEKFDIRFNKEKKYLTEMVQVTSAAIENMRNKCDSCRELAIEGMQKVGK